ncbi:lipopolysaccharide biosynthesis protein [Neobacillus sp. C211]|uniref:lipopolysaccharide biosynthesis protein n=1 Tax=unclassified Neobacillus TaxID=2675272 RepID=UPI00397A0DD7
MLNNTVWVLFTNILVQSVSLGTTLLLAKVLSPEYFGILAICTIFINLINLLQDGGFSNYLIQKKNVQKKDIFIVNVINIVSGIILGVVLWSISPFLGDFYKQDQIGSLLKFLSITLALSSISLVHRAIMIKEMRFKELSMIDSITMVLGDLVSLTLAYMNFDFVALLVRIGFKQLISTLLLLLKNRSLIRIEKFNFREFKEVYEFGFKILNLQLVTFLGRNIDTFLIGKLIGVRQVGIYSICIQWSFLVRNYIAQGISKVALPNISKYQDDNDKVKDIYLNMISWVAFLGFPIILGLLITADKFVLLAYGDKWSAAIIPLQILLASSIFSTLGTTVGSIFIGLGKPEIELRVNILSIIGLVVGIVLGAVFGGLIGVTIAILLKEIVIVYIFMLNVLKLIKARPKELLQRIIPALMSSIIMAILIKMLDVFLNIFVHINPILDYLGIVSLSVLVYFILTFLFNKQIVNQITPFIQSQIFKVFKYRIRGG